MDERKELGSVMCEPSRYGFVAGGFGSGRDSQMLVVRLPRGGTRSDHNIARNPLSVWGEGDEVSPFCFPSGCVDELLTVCVPSGFPAQLDPAVSESIVSAESRSLCAGEGVITVVAQLMMASTPRSERCVGTSLAWEENREANVLLNGQAQRGSWEQVMGSGRVPGHMYPHLPLPRDLWMGGGSRG